MTRVEHLRENVRRTEREHTLLSVHSKQVAEHFVFCKSLCLKSLWAGYCGLLLRIPSHEIPRGYEWREETNNWNSATAYMRCYWRRLMGVCVQIGSINTLAGISRIYFFSQTEREGPKTKAIYHAIDKWRHFNSTRRWSKNRTLLHLLQVFWSKICLFRDKTSCSSKNGVFWVVMPCGSCKNRRFGGTYAAFFAAYVGC
jgi:hypothetical protein